MLHLVLVLETKYILARDDVRAYSIAALGSAEIVEPLPSAISTFLIPYGQLFDELKMPLF
jgi:hypothetical protein